MNRILRHNRYFFICFLLFLLAGGTLLAAIEQGEAIYYFSERRSYWADLFFVYFTRMGEEEAYFVITLLMLFVSYRLALLIPVTGILVTIVAFLAKSFFAHPRPMAFFRDSGLLDTIQVVQGVDMHGGNTSFPSGHTLSAFALFGLLAFLLPRKKGMAIVLFAVALLVGISRIYLVQHFLKDVYLGAIMGVILAMYLYTGYNRFSPDPAKWYNRSLRDLKIKRLK